MTRTPIFSNRMKALFFFAGLCAAVLFVGATPTFAASPSDAATAVFGPTIANVPWEYIPAWYKAELIASGYSAPKDATFPPVMPGSNAPKAEVYGPTIANVPWKYVPEWYKVELASKGVTEQNAVAEIPTITGSLPPLSTLDAEATSNAQAGEAHDTIGKESVESAVASDTVATSGDGWSEQVTATEAHSSWMSETSFFFLMVGVLFVLLILVSIIKRRRSAARGTQGE